MSVRILVGDAITRLRELPDHSVHCCMTSPPYWGLRAYKGDEGMIGMEPTFSQHLENLIAVFREVRRVLRPDGTLWIDYGDSYVGGGRGDVGPGSKQRSNQGSLVEPPDWRDGSQWRGWSDGGLKQKDLMMMPARVAMALQADGWYLRSEIIWHKSNPMPESAKDRPTCAHEKVFLLTPSPRYFYDQVATMEPVSGTANARTAKHNTTAAAHGKFHRDGREKGGRPPGVTPKSVAMGEGIRQNESYQAAMVDQPENRNMRNVWKIATQSFKEAHFATFPEALVRIPVLAGTSEKGACPQCGAPWIREVWTPKPPRERAQGKTKDQPRLRLKTGQVLQNWRDENPPETTGWRPGCCDCAEEIRTSVWDGKVRPDPTLETGRRGLNRERNPNEPRYMTRGEQRDYARQIKESPRRDEIRRRAGEACAHYERTDRSGARPIPPGLLEEFLEEGLLEQPGDTCSCACSGSGDPVPCTVLDPFAGAGTTGLVAAKMNRSAILIEISPEYAEMSRRRIQGAVGLLHSVAVDGETAEPTPPPADKQSGHGWRTSRG